LHVLNGFTRDTNHVVVENLPLLRSTLVEHNFFVMNLFGADNVFNPVLEFNEDLLHARITLHSSSSTLSPVVLHKVVRGLNVVVVTRPRFNIELRCGLSAFEFVSQLLKTGITVNGTKLGVMSNDEVISFRLIFLEHISMERVLRVKVG